MVSEYHPSAVDEAKRMARGTKSARRKKSPRRWGCQLIAEQCPRDETTLIFLSILVSWIYNACNEVRSQGPLLAKQRLARKLQWTRTEYFEIWVTAMNLDPDWVREMVYRDIYADLYDAGVLEAFEEVTNSQ